MRHPCRLVPHSRSPVLRDSEEAELLDSEEPGLLNCKEKGLECFTVATRAAQRLRETLPRTSHCTA